MPFAVYFKKLRTLHCFISSSFSPLITSSFSFSSFRTFSVLTGLFPFSCFNNSSFAFISYLLLYNDKKGAENRYPFSTCSSTKKIYVAEINSKEDKDRSKQEGHNNVESLKNDDKEVLLKMLSRYSSLRPTDRMKLIRMHMQIQTEASEKKVLKWPEFRTEDLDEAVRIEKKKDESEIMEKKKADKIKEKLKPSYLRKRKIIAKRMTPTEEPQMTIVSGSFNDQTEELSLIEDCHKAEIYEDICRRLNNQWKEGRNVLTDRFFDVMTSAIRNDLMDQSRPVLVNELSDFDNPYLFKRLALQKLLIEKCSRNCLDESMVDAYLDSRTDLIKLKLQAKMPPEILEPLLAFRGDTRYHFDKRVRLQQKTDAVMAAVHTLVNDDNYDETKKIKKVLEVLPENQKSDEIHSSHPFANHFGFSSAVPWGFCGSIKMGKPRKQIDEELDKIRYPTLQRVAHSLPKDAKYRASVAHAIKILERSRGWDFESKLKAINSMSEVWNNMAPSSTYEKILNAALPIIRRRGMCRKTRSRQRVFNQGLTYIRSLTTNKPLHVRLQKKK